MNNSKDIRLEWKYGSIAVIDRNTQAVRGWMEVFVGLDITRRCIARTPDFEGSNLVSWGNVTPKEVARLVVCGIEEDRECALKQIAEFEEWSSLGSVVWTLFYKD